jgi:hypothetical protein
MTKVAPDQVLRVFGAWRGTNQVDVL